MAAVEASCTHDLTSRQDAGVVRGGVMIKVAVSFAGCIQPLTFRGLVACAKQHDDFDAHQAGAWVNLSRRSFLKVRMVESHRHEELWASREAVASARNEGNGKSEASCGNLRCPLRRLLAEPAR